MIAGRNVDFTITPQSTESRNTRMVSILCYRNNDNYKTKC